MVAFILRFIHVRFEAVCGHQLLNTPNNNTKGVTIQLLEGGEGDLDQLFISPPVCNILFISHTASSKIFIKLS